jgi:5-methylcytosine-specific restriction protein A
MLSKNLNLIKQTLSDTTGAHIELISKKIKNRDLIEIWFGELDKVRGPIIELSPAGTLRHNVKLRFGSFSNGLIDQIKEANHESRQLARLLLNTLSKEYSVIFPENMNYENWHIDSKGFTLEVERRGISDYLSDDEIAETCFKIITPVLGALVELIGYEYEELRIQMPPESNLEGEVKISKQVRRERNPRNRLVCINHHGDKCYVCGFVSSADYPSLSSVIEVHHIEELSEIKEPRLYDPIKDLVPLCPNCHRAIHKKKPAYLPDELKEMFNGNQ